MHFLIGWVSNLIYKNIIFIHRKIKSLVDAELHKGFHYGDSSYNDFGKKKRDISKNISLYFGIPYKIYSATNNYKYKSRNCNLL